MKNLVVKAMLYMGVALAMGATSLAQAQATRTWVSGVGDDVNPCSRTAPCKTFAGAIDKTAAGGEINALDDGAFGQITITKSITIDGGGKSAGILAPSGETGITIRAGANDRVILRRLSLSAVGATGQFGVRILSGGPVIIENSSIAGFTIGVMLPSTVANSRLDIRNVAITSGTRGINVESPGSITTVKGASIRGMKVGINVNDGTLALRHSQVSHNETGIRNGGGIVTTFGDNLFNANGVNSLGSSGQAARF